MRVVVAMSYICSVRCGETPKGVDDDVCSCCEAMFLVSSFCVFLCPRRHYNVSVAVTKPNVLQEGNSSEGFL